MQGYQADSCRWAGSSWGQTGLNRQNLVHQDCNLAVVETAVAVEIVVAVAAGAAAAVRVALHSGRCPFGPESASATGLRHREKMMPSAVLAFRGYL